MKRTFIILVFTMLSANIFSQIKFEKGYIIRETGEKVNCMIYNVDWRNNPKEIQYKEIGSDIIRTATLGNVSEFGINGFSKYKRFVIDIDRSSEEYSSLSYERNPTFNKEVLFLKIIIEGEATLYQYVDGNLKRYFFKVGKKQLKQLVNHTYINSKGEKIINNSFRQQLLVDLKCSNISFKDFKYLKYKKNDLKDIFIKYNTCNKKNFTNYDNKSIKDFMNIYFNLGLNNSSLSLKKYNSDLFSSDLNDEISLSFGFTFESVLPFEKNTWAIVIDPTYQYYKTNYTKKTSEVVGGEINIEVDYKSIELPIGIRHYFFFDDNSKLFINASYVFDFSLDSRVEHKRANRSAILLPFNIETRGNIAFGLGYTYKTYSVELRYQTNREILSNYIGWESDYKSMSLIFRYNIF